MSLRTQSRERDEDLVVSPKGQAAPWIVAIDELPGGQEWLLEIDSPYVYLTFQLRELSILIRAIDLLNSALVQHLPGSKQTFVPNRDDLALGHFGEASVQLLRDNEDFPRCFIVVESKSQCALRISLAADDIRAFVAALRLALADSVGAEKSPRTDEPQANS